MSIYTVARDDLQNLAASYLIRGIVGAFIAMVAFIFISEITIYDEPSRALFDVSNAVILLGPVLLAPVAYDSIVGDRISGRITFTMGLPNSRWEYFAGKTISRFTVVTVATVGSIGVGYLISLVTFANSPVFGRFAIFAGATLLYTLSFTSVFIAISALTKSRTMAMFAALAAYFVLVLFVLGVAPYLNLETLFAAVGDILGTSISDSVRYLIKNITPYPAYGGATHPIYTSILDEYQRLSAAPPSQQGKIHAQTWFDLSILLAWIVLPLATGFVKFRSSELS